MEMYAGPEQRTTETYMIPGSGSNPHLTYLPQLEEIDYMGNEGAPEFIFDQGLYYPAPNYYGYYCTGFESPGEWDDHNRFLGLDGQDPNYPGLQTESLPYVYYTPSYGYAQSPYNPYNPYIPGAVIGLDGPYLGTQQYVTNPSYQPPLSSPAYVPVVVQPSTDVPNSTQDPSLFSTGASMASRHVNAGVKCTPPLASTNIAANTQRSASGNRTPETSQSSQSTVKSSSEGSLVNAPPSKQSLSQGAMLLGSATHASQIRNSSGSAQATHHFSHGRVPPVQNPFKITMPSNDGFSQFGSNVRGWATVDKFRPRLQFNGVLNNPTGGTNVLGEQNKGPRTSRSRSQWTPAIVDETYPTKSGAGNAQRSIIISANQYNRDDFPVNYPNAKFFVIKSYSEDDVHKSIKYNVWSSTPNGNKRLDSAYEDAQRISVGQPGNCPIFLFFSVNASGQFCGVAEMIGPVNFDKDMEFWQQDKWTGSFPVKWHIIKDVPNTSVRHIILENNENKPVTNSRDTQEIPYLPGINMLNIFKSSTLKTSILDDFMFYEERERIMQEEKSRLLRRSYDASQFLPAVVPVNKTDGTIAQPPNADEKQSNDTVNDPSKADEKQLCGTSDQPPKAVGNQPNDPVNQPANADGEPHNGTVGQSLSSSGSPPNGAVDQPPKADGKPWNLAVYNPPKADGKMQNRAVDQPAKADGKPLNGSVDQPPKADRIPNKSKDATSICDQPPKTDRIPSKLKDPKSICDQPPKADREDPKSTGDRPSKADRNPSKPTDPKITGKAGTSDEQATRKLDSIKLSNDNARPDPMVANSTMKIGSHAIDPKEGETSSSGAMETESTPIDVVTVGSMRIKVKGLGESSSSIIGTIPIEPKSLKFNKQGALAGSHPHQK